MTAPDLKPCPFCAAMPVVYEFPEPLAGVEIKCTTSGCPASNKTPFSYLHNPDGAISAWNRRSVEAAKQVCDNVAEHAAKLERGQP
jgi:hypothetical protein